MGDYLQAGVVYVDGTEVNAANLNAHVNDAIFKSTAISSRTLKDPMAFGDEFIINDAGSLKKATMQQVYNLIIQSGTVIQRIEYDIATNGATTSLIPNDNTIPQISEGVLYSGPHVITPRNSNNKIAVEFAAIVSNSIANNVIIALFRNSVSDSICAGFVHIGGINEMHQIVLKVIDSPSTTSEVSYYIRFGSELAGTATINRNPSTSSFFGGKMFSSLVLEEVRQ